MQGSCGLIVCIIVVQAWKDYRCAVDRCLSVFPNDAGIGATPHMLAQALSLRIRSG